MAFNVFGERIKELRKEAELTQEELAIWLGISKQTMSIYENGRELPYEILCKIATRFDVSVDYLLGQSQYKRTAWQVINRDKLVSEYPMLAESFSLLLEKIAVCADVQQSINCVEKTAELLNCLSDITCDFSILSESVFHHAISNDDLIEHIASTTARATHKLIRGIASSAEVGINGEHC